MKLRTEVRATTPPERKMLADKLATFPFEGWVMSGAEVIWRDEKWIVFDAVATGVLPGGRGDRVWIGGVLEHEALERNPTAYDIELGYVLLSSKDWGRIATGVPEDEIDFRSRNR